MPAVTTGGTAAFKLNAFFPFWAHSCISPPIAWVVAARLHCAAGESLLNCVQCCDRLFQVFFFLKTFSRLDLFKLTRFQVPFPVTVLSLVDSIGRCTAAQFLRACRRLGPGPEPEPGVTGR